MRLSLCKAKIHRARVTDAQLNYRGSLTLDADWMRRAGILPFEELTVGNLANGNRFVTYAIPAPAGSRTVCLNGAVAHLGTVGDRLIVLVFASVEPDELPGFRHRLLVLDDNNEIAEEKSVSLEDALGEAGT